MQVSLPALRAFEAAARLGSFKEAAAELSISPTAVSHHISKLEQRLSTALFIRAGRQVTLTESGKELAAATSEGFQTIETAIDNIAAKEKHINVTTTSSFAALVLIPSLHDFYDRYPDSNVNITSGESIEVNNFALSIRFGEMGNQSTADIIKPETFNLFGAARTVGTFDQPEPITVYTTNWKNAALPKVPLQEWLQLNELQDRRIDVRFFDQELFGIQQALLENAFVFCSRTLVKGYLKAGVLSEVKTRAMGSRLCYYIADKERQLSRHNVMFVEWLESLLNQG